MANRRIEMLNLIHLIHQLHEDIPYRDISKNLRISKTTVQNYANLFKSLNLELSELATKSQSELSDLLSNLSSPVNDNYQKFDSVFCKYETRLLSGSLNRKEVYSEYLKTTQKPLSYGHFCELISKEFKIKDVDIHLEHKPGDKLFVDFAGKKLSYIEQSTGQKISVDVFVATLGHSQKSFVYAVANQKKEIFLLALEKALHYFGGVTVAIVPDNLKSGVTKGSRYEGILNESFKHFCEHYDCFPFPTRPYKPKDKNLVENMVKLSYSYIYKHLAKKIHHSLDDLNKSILELLENFNNKHFSNRDFSRNDLFNRNEKNLLKPLPVMKYEFVNFLNATVRKNYHVYFSPDKHFYSVSYEYTGKIVKLLYNSESVEIFYNYQRIATHKRDLTNYKYSTNPDHLAPNHRFLVEDTEENFLKLSEEIGCYTREVVTRILSKNHYKDQKFRTIRGILSLSSKKGKEILELSCKRALHFDSCNYQQILNIADKKLYLEDNQPNQANKSIDKHKNKRGKDYYAVKS